MKRFTLSLRTFKKLFAYGTRIRTSRDWLFLIACTAVLLTVSILWNVYLFGQLASGKVIGASQNTSTTTAPVSVTQAQELFKQRAAEESNYQSLYHLVDPSLPSS